MAEERDIVKWLMSPTKRQCRKSNEEEIDRYAGFPMAGAIKKFTFWLDWRNKISRDRLENG